MVPGSPADQLWHKLDQIHGIGWVTAGKLLARKRPRLIPVYDNVVRDVVGKPDSFWLGLRAALRADGRGLQERLVRMRTQAEVGDDISAIRVFDVVAWMSGKGLPREAETSAVGPAAEPTSV